MTNYYRHSTLKNDLGEFTTIHAREYTPAGAIVPNYDRDSYELVNWDRLNGIAVVRDKRYHNKLA